MHGSPAPSVLVDPPRFGLPAGDPVLLRVSSRDRTTVEFRADHTRFLLTVVCAGIETTANECVHALGDWWLDAILAKVVVGDPADLLLVAPARDTGVWMALLSPDDGDGDAARYVSSGRRRSTSIGR